MAGLIDAHRAMLDPGELTIEDLLEDSGFDEMEAPLVQHEAMNPVFDFDLMDPGATYDQLDQNMTQNPESAGGPEDIEAIREMLIERARSRHMATDDFQHQLSKSRGGF
jgi:hypothetical protein